MPYHSEEYRKAYYTKNKDRFKKNTREYQIRTYPRMLYNSCKNRALRKGVEFTLIPEDIVVPEFCPILGIKIVPLGSRKEGHGASVDRKDNSKGYIKENIVVCSLKANRMKSDHTIEELEKLINYLRNQ